MWLDYPFDWWSYNYNEGRCVLPTPARRTPTRVYSLFVELQEAGCRILRGKGKRKMRMELFRVIPSFGHGNWELTKVTCVYVCRRCSEGGRGRRAPQQPPPPRTSRPHASEHPATSALWRKEWVTTSRPVRWGHLLAGLISRFLRSITIWIIIIVKMTGYILSLLPHVNIIIQSSSNPTHTHPKKAIQQVLCAWIKHTNTHTLHPSMVWRKD